MSVVETATSLCDEYEAFLKRENLPSRCAEDLLFEFLFPAQRNYLHSFIDRWDACVNRCAA